MTEDIQTKGRRAASLHRSNQGLMPLIPYPKARAWPHCRLQASSQPQASVTIRRQFHLTEASRIGPINRSQLNKDPNLGSLSPLKSQPKSTVQRTKASNPSLPNSIQGWCVSKEPHLASKLARVGTLYEKSEDYPHAEPLAPVSLVSLTELHLRRDDAIAPPSVMSKQDDHHHSQLRGTAYLIHHPKAVSQALMASISEGVGEDSPCPNTGKRNFRRGVARQPIPEFLPRPTGCEILPS